MKRRDALLGLTSLAATATSAHAQNNESWDEVVAAAKKEGVLVWSFFGAPGAATERQAKEFEQLYGIKVELAPGRTGDFEARWNAERAAGKASIDIRSSGSPENRRLAARGLAELGRADGFSALSEGRHAASCTPDSVSGGTPIRLPTYSISASLLAWNRALPMVRNDWLSAVDTVTIGPSMVISV